MGLDKAPNSLRMQMGLISFFLGSAVHAGHTHKNFTNKQIYFEYVPQHSTEVYYHWNSICLWKSPSCPTGHFVLHWMFHHPSNAVQVARSRPSWDNRSCAIFWLPAFPSSNWWISWPDLWYKACTASTCSAVWARYRTWTYWQKGKIAVSVGKNKNYDVADLGSIGDARIIWIDHHWGKHRCQQIIWRFFWAERVNEKSTELVVLVQYPQVLWSKKMR